MNSFFSDLTNDNINLKISISNSQFLPDIDILNTTKDTIICKFGFGISVDLRFFYKNSNKKKFETTESIFIENRDSVKQAHKKSNEEFIYINEQVFNNPEVEILLDNQGEVRSIRPLVKPICEYFFSETLNGKKALEFINIDILQRVTNAINFSFLQFKQINFIGTNRTVPDKLILLNHAESELIELLNVYMHISKARKDVYNDIKAELRNLLSNNFFKFSNDVHIKLNEETNSALIKLKKNGKWINLFVRSSKFQASSECIAYC